MWFNTKRITNPIGRLRRDYKSRLTGYCIYKDSLSEMHAMLPSQPAVIYAKQTIAPAKAIYALAERIEIAANYTDPVAKQTGSVAKPSHLCANLYD